MDPELERRTLAAEDRHWWYVGRRAIVLDAVGRRRAAGPRTGGALLDAGCGGGAELAELARRGRAVGVEPSGPSRAAARARGAGEVVDAQLQALPFADGEFALGICLDVLEHVDDDVGCLAELARVTASGGGLVVTVPAHPRLWGRHDELNQHRRRYTRASLGAAARAGGWKIARLTHFNALLLPAVFAARRFGAGAPLALPPAPVNRALAGVLGLERRAIAAGVALPAGASLLAELSR